MARITLVLETEDGQAHDVTVWGADVIAVNRAIEADGRHPAMITQTEYNYRLAHRAGQRLGLIEKSISFEDWLETGVDVERAAAALTGEEGEVAGEAKATPAE